jgi:molecular chaperone DnaJ
MSDNKDYYKVLSLSNDCTHDDIKKSFRKLSYKHHPDKNDGNDSVFKEVSEAYSILSDKDKRRQYDMERNMGNPADLLNSLFSGGVPMGGGGLHNIFTSFNGNRGNFFANMNGFNIFENINIIPPVKHTIQVTLEDIFNKKSKKTTIKKFKISNNVKSEFSEVHNITIPDNVIDTRKIIIENSGNIIGNNTGELIIKLNILPNNKYTVQDNNIFYNHTISLKEALCGFSFKLNYLDNKTYQINNNKHIIYHNYRKKINNLGLSSINGKGCLYIIFNVTFPESLTPECQEKLKHLL